MIKMMIKIKEPKEPKEKHCSQCYETVAVHSLKEIIEDKDCDNDLEVIDQAKLLINEHFCTDDEIFCEECFWK